MAYVAINTQSLRGQDLDKLLRDRGPEIQKAVNDTAKFGFEYAADIIGNEIRFPPGYLKSSKRLRMREGKAVGEAAIISARKRSTSLAQFVRGDPGFGQRGGVSVQVLKAGGPSHLRKAFMMRTKAGKAGSGNVGIMMREAAYAELSKKRSRKTNGGLLANRMGTVMTGAAEAGKSSWNGLRPLYTVSVDQAFSTFRGDIALSAEMDLSERINKIIGDNS